GAWDRLFANRGSPPSSDRAAVRFTYGQGDHRGIPIFFIVPEDGKTRGMDGVRDYVSAHPSDFKGMAAAADDGLGRYTWFRDFLSSLSQGAIDPSARDRVTAIASSLGVPATNVNACYVPGSPPSVVSNCIQSALLAVQVQPNIDAPTQAQFFGGITS